MSHVLYPQVSTDSCPECGHEQFVATLSVTHTVTFDDGVPSHTRSEDLSAYKNLYCPECGHHLIHDGEISNSEHVTEGVTRA